MTASKHVGHCFCGAVEIEVSGEPAAMGNCHCQSCRHWSAGPVNAFTLWQPEAVRVTRGAALLGTHRQTEHSARQWCTRCGGHVMTEHPGMKLIDVYAAIVPSVRFAPALHVHYGESVLPIRDGLPKWRDMPGDLGGSGVTLPE